MIQRTVLILALTLLTGLSSAQRDNFKSVNFLIGEWTGTGNGFGNNQSKIESVFRLIMDRKYIEVTNESQFEPNEKNLDGEHHIDRGFISFDKARKLLVYRQFNNEGYVNQYVLSDSLSTEADLVFETEAIENFVPGGKARFTIKKIAENKIETTFDVSFPNKDFSCVGINTLEKK